MQLFEAFVLWYPNERQKMENAEPKILAGPIYELAKSKFMLERKILMNSHKYGKLLNREADKTEWNDIEQLQVLIRPFVNG